MCHADLARETLKHELEGACKRGEGCTAANVAASNHKQQWALLIFTCHKETSVFKLGWKIMVNAHVVEAQQVDQSYRRVSAVDDRGQGQHSPVCIHNDWVDNGVLDDRHKLLQLGIIV